MSVSIDISQISNAKAFLKTIRKATETAQYRAVNYAATKARTEARKAISGRYNLKAGYINETLEVKPKASTNRPAAILRARKRPTRLARYGAKQLTAAARGAGGDSLRGIAPGRKQAGVSVKVRRGGQTRKMRKAFLVPLRNAGVMGAFIRTGTGKSDIKHLYGPSVDQAFKWVRDQGALKNNIRANMVREYRRLLGVELRRGASR